MDIFRHREFPFFLSFLPSISVMDSSMLNDFPHLLWWGLLFFLLLVFFFFRRIVLCEAILATFDFLPIEVRSTIQHRVKSMSWKKNVLFVPEKKTNFLQKQSKLLPNWRKCSPKWNQTPLQEKAWMKTYFLCLKRKSNFLQKQAKFHPNQRKCSPKGNKIQPEKERIFCTWKENVFFCESKQKFSPTGENFHSKETKHTWRSHQVPGSQVKYLRRERIVWYSRTIWNVEHAIQWEHFELSKVDM